MRHTQIPGLVLIDHVVAAPLDHAAPGGPTIDVFAREVVAVDKVHDDLQLETAARVGNVRTWVTNDFEHDGLRIAGDRVLGRLMEMMSGRR